MSEKKDIYWRAYLVYFGVATLMLIVIIRTVMIQFDGGQPVFMSSASGSEKMPTKTVERQPRRGQILDANYTPLVTSVSYYDIHMDPTVIPKAMVDSSLSDLAVALNELYPEKTAREYERIILKGIADTNRYVLIHKRATNEERKKLREMPIFNQGRFKGGLIDNVETIKRVLPHGELMRRTLGYVRIQEDDTLFVGIEGAYDKYLTGVPGQEVMQKISTGWKRIGPIVREPVEGATIVTTIDKEIQEVAHSELKRQLTKQKAMNGSVIVMDVRTGYVKAIVNLVRHEDGEYYESYNNAIGTKEVPGSTFKLASLMALLEDEKVSLSDKVNAVGVYKFFNDKLTDSNHGYGYGEITIQEAFEKSSNVFSRIVYDAYKDEPQRFVDRLKSFGIGSKLNIDLNGEPDPTLYEPGKGGWSGISLPWMAVGYEVQQTPLQTLAFYNAVANNGTYVRPQFVKEIRRGNELEKKFPPVIIKDKICSDQTLADLKACLKGVVQRGTGKSLNSTFFDIAGKTGTARVLGKNNNYEDNRYLASFAGYFPADNPIYSCIVVVTGPTEDIYGAVVSGTVFTAIANKVYASSLAYHRPVNEGVKRQKGIPQTKVGNRKDLMELFERFRIPYTSLTDKEYAVVRDENDKAIIERRYVGRETVPNVVGMTAKDAVYLIESTGMSVRMEGYGRVVSQSIKAGTQAAPGVVIKIELK